MPIPLNAKSPEFCITILGLVFSAYGKCANASSDAVLHGGQQQGQTGAFKPNQCIESYEIDRMIEWQCPEGFIWGPGLEIPLKERPNSWRQSGSLRDINFDNGVAIIEESIYALTKATRRGRSWHLTIQEQRLEFSDVLNDNPGLKPQLQALLTHSYQKAKIRASKVTGLGLDTGVFQALALGSLLNSWMMLF